MQVTTQEQHTTVTQNRGYWGYEEIDLVKLKQIAGAGDGDGDGDGCGDGDGGMSDDDAENFAMCFDDPPASTLACILGGPPSTPGLNGSVNGGYDALGNPTGQPNDGSN